MNFFKNFFKQVMSNKIIINGQEFNVQGTNISVANDRIYVDGKLVTEGLRGSVKVEWHGPLASLDCDTAVINGDVHGNVDADRISCANVTGDIDCDSIKCGDVKGNIDADSVTCGNVIGDIDADTIKQRRG